MRLVNVKELCVLLQKSIKKFPSFLGFNKFKLIQFKTKQNVLHYKQSRLEPS